MSRTRWRSTTILLWSLCFACISSEIDPRCTINAPDSYRDIVAQCVNASEFWQTYFDELEATSPGKPLVAFEVRMERKVSRRSKVGDYDPGWVIFHFKATNLRTRRALFEKKGDVRLDDMIFGWFDRVYADSCGLKTAFLGNGGRNAATIFSLRYSSSR